MSSLGGAAAGARCRGGAGGGLLLRWRGIGRALDCTFDFANEGAGVWASSSTSRLSLARGASAVLSCTERSACSSMAKSSNMAKASPSACASAVVGTAVADRSPNPSRSGKGVDVGL
jgi:hypothetical protein